MGTLEFEGDREACEKALFDLVRCQPDCSQLAAILGILDGPGSKFTVGSDSSNVRIVGIESDSIGPLVRAELLFWREEGALLVELRFIHIQGKPRGFGKKMLLAQFRAFERLGVARVRVEPVEVGQYLWPRLGFERESLEHLGFLRGIFATWLVSNYDYGKEPEAALEHSELVTSIGDLACTAVGKDFLLWLGKQAALPALPLVLSMIDRESETYRSLFEYLSQEGGSTR